MSLDCHQVRALLAGWIDAALQDDVGSEVGRHVEGCPACLKDAAGQRAVRDLLRTRAPQLREQAPVHLRELITERTHPSQPSLPDLPVPLPWGAVPAATLAPVPAAGRRWSLPVAAIIVFGLFGGALVSSFAPSGSLLASELALDHFKCRLFPAAKRLAPAAEIEQRWREQRGWTLSLPPADPSGDVNLTSVRRCLFHGGSIAHLLYSYHGQTVSLYVFPSPRRSAPALEIMGVRTATWTSGDRTFGLVANVGARDFAALATEFETRTR